MLSLLPALLLTGVIDGEAALRHASALAALGPHPWGSPRARPAAEYVLSQFRDAGLEEVRLQEFESYGIRGTNVVGVLRAPGREFVVVGAHHDTAPEAPGAYDDGGGVGVLIEVARALSRERARPRTLVFVSFDAEEAWSAAKAGASGTPGSRAYIDSLDAERRNLVAALIVEMCGWKGGSPVFHPIAYPDPMRPGRSVITPAWLLRAALAGARESGAPLSVGDPLIPWLYQPTVRTFRIPHHYGDDLSFLQMGLPATFVSDSSFSAYYPWYHQPGDTKDKIDGVSLARMGQGVLGIVGALGRAPRGPSVQPGWFSAFGAVAGAEVLLALGALSIVPGLLWALSAGGLGLVARLAQSVLFGVLLWRHPVPALWVFLLPNLLTVVGRTWATAVSLLPALSLAGLGILAWTRGYVGGVWLAPWELVVTGLTLALVLVRPKAGRGHVAPRKGRRWR